MESRDRNSSKSLLKKSLTGSSSTSSITSCNRTKTTAKTNSGRVEVLAKSEQAPQQHHNPQTKKRALARPALPPPPPIVTFSDDTTTTNEGSSSNSSEETATLSSSSSETTGRETKKIKRISPPRQAAHQQNEPQGWRVAAQAILDKGPVVVGKGLSRRNFAVVCSSNVNRSIMAQRLLERNDFRVRSYGTGRWVENIDWTWSFIRSHFR